MLCLLFIGFLSLHLCSDSHLLCLAGFSVFSLAAFLFRLNMRFLIVYQLGNQTTGLLEVYIN